MVLTFIPPLDIDFEQWFGCCALESACWWRLSTIKVLLELEFLQIDYPKYFSSYLLPYSCGCNTKRTTQQDDPIIVPRFHPSTEKSAKNYSFAFDAPSIWNDLPVDIHASPTIDTFRWKLKAYPFSKAYSP